MISEQFKIGYCTSNMSTISQCYTQYNSISTDVTISVNRKIQYVIHSSCFTYGLFFPAFPYVYFLLDYWIMHAKIDKRNINLRNFFNFSFTKYSTSLEISIELELFSNSYYFQNYNKSRIHSYRGARQVQISLDGVLIFIGEIRKACGGILGGVDAFGDVSFNFRTVVKFDIQFSLFPNRPFFSRQTKQFYQQQRKMIHAIRH